MKHTFVIVGYFNILCQLADRTSIHKNPVRITEKWKLLEDALGAVVGIISAWPSVQKATLPGLTDHSDTDLKSK
jgi:hypothetical protein